VQHFCSFGEITGTDYQVV